MIIEDFFDPLDAQVEPELLISRRAFAVSQEEFAGAVERRIATQLDVGWHSNVVNPELGALALVRPDGVAADLVGTVLKLTRWQGSGDRVLYVYVIGTEGVGTDISVTRRAFMQLGLLANASLPCDVERVAR